MEIFKNLEEMKPYYNEKTNTYEFIENGRPIDIVIDFKLDINSNIRAGNINARDIIADDITAWDIRADDISAYDIIACDIKARDIIAEDISAYDISAYDIIACDIKARDIIAEDISANNIRYNSVCYARQKFVCNSIKGTRPNSKYFCLDSEIVIIHSEDICVQK